MQATPRQIEILQHSLGVRVKGDASYRNRYVTGLTHYADADLRVLVSAGLMSKQPAPSFCGEDALLYQCTPLGIALAMANLEEPPKRTKYRQWLNCDCDDSFAEFLGVTLPVYERQGCYAKGFEYRMVRPTDAKYSKIAGEWCKTKKAAKASYKAALKSRKGGE